MDNNQSTYLTGLYITANRSTNYKNHSKPPSITNELIISPENDTYTSLPCPLDTRNQTVEFLKYSTYRTNLLKTEFLDYLMKEENFSNLNESEKFLREKVIENLNIINRNNSEIEKKKAEYKKIILELNTELNKNLKINPDDVDDENHKKKKEDLKKKITLKKSDLNVLETLYRQEYKTRYLLIQQQKSEVENIKVNLKQYEKYTILNKKISIEANQKETLLNDVKNYVEQSREVFSNEIDNKMKIYNDLEYEVLILKKNTENIEKNLLKIKEMKHKIKELIKYQNEINYKIGEKNKSISNNISSLKVQISKNTEMKNIELETLIHNYNEIQNKMHKLEKDLFNTNQQISDLNKILHKLNDEEKFKKNENKIIKEIKPKNTNKDLFTNNFNAYILKDKIKSIKIKNEELVYLCNTKSNLMILYFKFLFEYTNIIYKSYDNSKLDFNFNLDNRYKYLKKIMESKYFELIKWDQITFKKILTNDNEIFKEPKNFLLFSIQIFLNFFSSVEIILSNILNITCYSNEDLMLKFPLSQFNKSLIELKKSENDDNSDINRNFVIKKESNKVEILKFNKEENIKNYYQYLDQSANILSQKNILLSRTIDDIFQGKSYIKRNSENGAMETNYPNKVFSSFLNNKNTHNVLKKSRYINNYPSTTLLTLKRFFGAENKEKLFKGFQSADKNKIINNRYNQTKNSHNTIDTSKKINHNNFSTIKATTEKSNQMKNKEINDLYFSKEYHYEFEIDENPNKIKKKKLLGNNKRKIHTIKYSSDDPQKQLIFARMNDLRNLELFTNNSNNKSTSTNDIANDKIQESKFYEMYDKFKQKYFINSGKINSGYQNYNRYNKFSKKDSNSITSISCTSNKNINLIKGMKFIRNNSDFFYGVNTSKNMKNLQYNQKQKLPYIKNLSSSKQFSAELLNPGDGSKESL